MHFNDCGFSAAVFVHVSCNRYASKNSSRETLEIQQYYYKDACYANHQFENSAGCVLPSIMQTTKQPVTT